MNDYISLDYIKSIQKSLGIIGSSESILDAMSTLVEVAPTDLAVLITGETGTGKEVFANAVHSLSSRSEKTFISVNCGAIPETLLESELFGHEKGAFTGAVDRRIGFFEAADRGTIFLDEIGEMPIQTQVKLLRILESGEFSRLGSSKVFKVDVRVIAATNRNINEEIKAKKFRSDLYYRLNQVSISLPSLREHIHDIPLYFHHFASNICKKNGIVYQGITDDAITMLKSQNWKGNIREFKNFVDKVITLEKGREVDAAIINKYIPQALPSSDYHTIDPYNALVPVKNDYEIINNDTLVLRTLIEIKHDIIGIKHLLSGLGVAFGKLDDDITSIKEQLNNIPIETEFTFETIADMERALIIQTLEKFRSRSESAKKLGISERTLYRKVEKYGIDW